MALRPRIKRLLSKKQTISQDEYDRIEQEAAAAQELLEDPRFKFLRDYLETTRTSISETIIENRVTEVREELTVSNKLKRLFITPKQVQLDELAGQYKLVGQILTDLRATASMKANLEEALKNGEVRLEEDGEE